MNTRWTLLALSLAALVIAPLIAPKSAHAQQPAPPVEAADGAQPAEQPADGVTPPTAPVEEPAEEPVEEPVDEPVDEPTGPSPISDLAGGADDQFTPLPDIEEQALDDIFPATTYPYLEWHGSFRVRSASMSGFDLGTGGTSAILPPLERFTPQENPADPDADHLWSSDLRLRLEPKLHIAEGVSIHIEADMLRNVVLGSNTINQLSILDPFRPDPSRNLADGGQYSPREREWYGDAVQISEAYGQLDGFFGTVQVGRMDNHWGLGMFYNGGDCLDCNFGDSIDRAMWRAQLQGIYLSAAIEFPGEGLTSASPFNTQAQPYDLSQKDEVDQYTFSVLYAPLTAQERELARKRLIDDRKPLWHGGLLFSLRDQEGTTPIPANAATPALPDTLIYQGLDYYIVNGWGRFLYEPNSTTRMRVELEVMGILGSVENASLNAVGQPQGEDAAAVNCFDETVRSRNQGVCGVNRRDVRQLGVALESEFYLGGPIAFGFNGGYASGDTAPNWGYGRTAGQTLDDVNFFRFDPDYHVDLIMFRNTIGTVTNAFYFNPYLQASFLERGGRKLRLDVDAILGRAVNQAGTPAGDDPWLGLEVDAAVRFLLRDSFHAAVEGGFLFPMAGMNARQDRQRLMEYGNNTGTFIQDAEASTAWTLQFKTFWNF